MSDASTTRSYAPDKFTEEDVLRQLDSAGLRYKVLQRYILSQCPLHDDAHPSVQIFRDDWFANCHSGCGRFHITKAFPQLRNPRNSSSAGVRTAPRRAASESELSDYKTFDLMDEWQKMEPIPRNHYFKNIPLEVLDELGWRWIPDYEQYFIPYFSASKQSIPFAQYRNLDPDRPRFMFLKDAKPTCYGTWNLDNSKLFVVEGASDAAVLQACDIPWIAVPSASSGALAGALAVYCKQNGIQLVYAGDNDTAGLKIAQALEENITLRFRQPRPAYKDWGEMYEAEGQESVTDYCLAELAPYVLDNIQQVFPDAKELTLVGGGNGGKDPAPPPRLL